MNTIIELSERARKTLKFHSIIAFLFSAIASTAAVAQPKPMQHCEGVYEFYGHPSLPSRRGSGLRILFFIGERESMLRCFEHSRMATAFPLEDQLNSGRYRDNDEQLLRSTAIELGLNDPYIANGGI